jgi:myo-inositol-1(or 4)-monophosphatase
VSSQQQSPARGDTDDALAFAAGLVQACGEYAAAQQAGVAEEKKKDAPSLSGAVVTAVDLEVERRVDAALADRFPADAFVGEEYALRPGTSGRTWHVDPVDGTLNYARRLGPWSVVLSAWTDERCDLVAVWTQGVLYTAARGRGAWRDGERLRLPVSDVERGGLVRVPARIAAAALAAGWLARSVDSSATEMCQVADGRITGTVRLGGHPRDLHGPALLVEEAGGRVTDLSGGEWTSSSTGLVAAATGAHAALLELVPRG